MFALSVLRRVPPRFSTWMIFTILPVFLLFRFLFGSIVGVLIVSIFAYWSMWFYGDSSPYSFYQLIIWVDALPLESKTAIVTSVITVLGFLIAFHTATVNWKEEALAHLKADVANDIEQFFNEASLHVIDAEIYVQSLVEAVNIANTHGATRDAAFNVQRALSKTPAFLATRDRLAAMSVEVHRIAGRHSTVLSTVSGATRVLADCAGAFAHITRRMWIIVPSIPAAHSDPIGEFVAQVNLTECADFLESCERNGIYMHASTGGVRGVLLAPMVGFNFASLIGMYGNKTMLVNALAMFRDKRQ